MLDSIHHIAIICSDYQKSKYFYTEILELQIVNETYREDRESYKLDLSLNGNYVLELFSFPEPPNRISRPEASGLRHLAFGVKDINMVIKKLNRKGVLTEEVRIDKFTNKKFTFFSDPDNLPIEIYES